MSYWYSKMHKIAVNDKLQHFVYGIAVASLVYPFGNLFMIITVSFIAWLKEYIDSKGYGQLSKIDMFVTVMGGAFLVGWYKLVEYIKLILENAPL